MADVSGGSLATLVLSVAAWLLEQAGAPVTDARVIPQDAKQDRSWLLLSLGEARATRDAVHEAARIVRDLLRGSDPELDEAVAVLARRFSESRPQPAALAIMQAAQARGIPVRRDDDDGTIQLGLGATLHRLPATMSDGDVDLDTLYPPGQPTTIPVIAITGTNGKTTTTRLIAHLFRAAGHRVGFTTTDGVYFQEQLLKQGDLTGPFAASMIISHPEVDVAVLETARGGILRAGLGYSECDVAVVTNVSADHLGLGGIDTIEQLAELKSVVPAVVKPSGCAVLNADDPLVVQMERRVKGRVAWFTMQPGTLDLGLAEHVAGGGVVARTEGEGDAEEVVLLEGNARTSLGIVSEIPLTFGGLARFQVANVLAAVAAAHAQGVPVEVIRRALMSFAPGAEHTPGRLNVIETSRGRVIMDYAHNPAAIAALLEFVRRAPGERRMALLGAPGDRRDEDLREIGRLSAGLDLVVFKEHAHYRRGRPTGEIARIMAEGALEAGAPKERVMCFDEESDAVAHVMGLMRTGDVVVIVADDMDAVTVQLSPFAFSPARGVP